MSETIEQRVKSIIVKQLSAVPEALDKPEVTFQGDLKADSLDLVEIIMAFEDEFGITIPEDKAANIKTVGDAIKHIEAAVAEKKN
jgi:acyl carrier protein